MGPDPVLEAIQRVNRGPDYQPLDYGFDDVHIPWFLLWEISWICAHSDLKPGMKVLDLGGSASLFSYYLASKAMDVITIDINPVLVAAAKEVADKTGWPLQAKQMDMTAIDFPTGSFDRVFSICVYEHLPRSARIITNRAIRRILRVGGRFCITFDYQNPEPQMSISSPEDVHKQFVDPLGMKVLGNPVLHDNGKRYLVHPWFASRYKRLKKVLRAQLPLRSLWSTKPAHYSFASLFCERQGE